MALATAAPHLAFRSAQMKVLPADQNPGGEGIRKAAATESTRRLNRTHQAASRGTDGFAQGAMELAPPGWRRRSLIASTVPKSRYGTTVAMYTGWPNGSKSHASAARTMNTHDEEPTASLKPVGGMRYLPFTGGTSVRRTLGSAAGGES